MASATKRVNPGFSDGPAPAEAAMLLPALRGILRLRWATQMTPIAVELPWHQKRIDVVFATSLKVVALELKVDKWTKAIEQAYVNRWLADESWIGIWHASITSRTMREASEAGVGLLAVTSGTVYPLRRPGATPRPRPDHVYEAVVARRTNVRDLLRHAKS